MEVRELFSLSSAGAPASLSAASTALAASLNNINFFCFRGGLLLLLLRFLRTPTTPAALLTTRLLEFASASESDSSATKLVADFEADLLVAALLIFALLALFALLAFTVVDVALAFALFIFAFAVTVFDLAGVACTSFVVVAAVVAVDVVDF